MSEAEFQHYCVEGFVRPFDLLSGEPLCRFELVRTPDQLYLLLDIHHMISDGLSHLLLMRRDLSAAYEGTPLEQNGYGMYEAAEDELKSFDSAAYNKAKEFCREKFQDCDFTQLNVTGVKDSSKILIESAFLPMRSADLWCQENGTAANLLFMAAFSLVLSRLSRNKDVMFYTVNHGRMDKRLMDAYGMFVKTVPILSSVSGKQNVLDFVKLFRRELMQTIRYGIYPFTHFCRDMKKTPTVSFGFQSSAIQEALVLNGEEFPFRQLPRRSSMLDLNCVIYSGNGQYEIRLEASAAKYTTEYLKLFAGMVKSCVLAMMAHPQEGLADLSLVAEPESQELLELGHGETLEYDQAETFVDLFLRNAAQFSAIAAVADEASSITYGELDRRSNTLALELRRLGVDKDHFVGLMLPRRKEFLIAMLAVFKAGGAYVPLDSEYPDERLRYMLADSEAQVLITTRTLQQKKKLAVEHTVFLDEFDFSGNMSPVNDAEPDSLAYMIYTSGSTGKPKGVMVEHRNLRAFAAWRVQTLNLKPGESCAQHASFSFDASLDDLITPLAAGGTVHILASGLRQDIDGMCRYFKEHSIVGLTLSTQLGMELLNGSDDLPLRFLMMGGEKLKPTKPCNVQIINGYGPTEFTVCSSFQKVDQSKTYDNIPIGRPVPNSISAIVDETGHLLPRGVSGELCLIGRQMARGYWHRPELTAEKFANCPFLPGEKMYHTGDLACWNESGELEYQGRIDNQVKLRGFRIEMGEIETALVGFPGIQSATAEVKEVNGAPQLCAYYTSAVPVDEAVLKRHLNSSLTEYMVPAFYIHLDAMPLTPNGKIDRKALLPPNVCAMKKLEKVPPATNKEAALLQIAQEILQNKEFGVTDDLLALGMSSIQAIRFSAQVQKLKIHISTSTLTKKRSIRRILAASPTIFSWHKPYDPGKPVLVYFLGLSYPAFSQWFLDRLSERFSVLVFEPISEHYKYLFLNETFTDLLNLYFDIICFKVPKDAGIFGFCGICWGGVVAYHIGDMYRNLYGEKPSIFMIDSFLYSDEERRSLLEKMKNVDLSSANFSVLGNDYHDYEHRSEAAVNKMENLHPYPAYDGPVVLYSSEKNGDPRGQKENQVRWRQLASQIEIIGIDDDHIRVCEAEEYFATYLKKIFSLSNRALSASAGK